VGWEVIEQQNTTKAAAIIQVNLLVVFLKCAGFLDAINKP
jgi:hypothetical protein